MYNKFMREIRINPDKVSHIIIKDVEERGNYVLLESHTYRTFFGLIPYLKFEKGFYMYGMYSYDNWYKLSEIDELDMIIVDETLLCYKPSVCVMNGESIIFEKSFDTMEEAMELVDQFDNTEIVFYYE